MLPRVSVGRGDLGLGHCARHRPCRAAARIRGTGQDIACRRRVGDGDDHRRGTGSGGHIGDLGCAGRRSREVRRRRDADARDGVESVSVGNPCHRGREGGGRSGRRFCGVDDDRARVRVDRRRRVGECLDPALGDGQCSLLVLRLPGLHDGRCEEIRERDEGDHEDNEGHQHFDQRDPVVAVSTRGTLFGMRRGAGAPKRWRCPTFGCRSGGRVCTCRRIER